MILQLPCEGMCFNCDSRSAHANTSSLNMLPCCGRKLSKDVRYHIEIRDSLGGQKQMQFHFRKDIKLNQYYGNNLLLYHRVTFQILASNTELDTDQVS